MLLIVLILHLAAAFIFALALLCVSHLHTSRVDQREARAYILSVHLSVWTKCFDHCYPVWSGSQRGVHRMENKRKYSTL